MAEFSWSDSVKAAFAPCLSCLNSACRTHRDDRPSSQGSSRPDLDRLLQDVDTDTEAETLSLHSNIGDSRRKRKKKRSRSKTITLFGYNLFGKPPIRLEGDDDLTSATVPPVGRRGSSNVVKKSISTSTLDSDAAPLDPSTIAQLSAAQPSSGPSEEDSRKKEERRRRRRERKERKEALARAMGQADEEFEGFPGSGPGVPAPSSPREFILVSPISPNDELVEDADFDAEAYNTRRHTGSVRSDSDSRSRTSASTSNLDSSHYGHYYSQQPAPIPAPTTRRPNSFDALQKKRKSSRPKGSSKTSSSKASQSPPIRSPVDPVFPSHPIIVNPEFEGFPDDGTFPSTGFGGGRMSRKNSEMGVILARRGDN
ncbi:hypothetical protein BJ322DRAFT_646934 [Thelephora terrestris]|uniref:Uncharacterized protein n=1 Tax=Thelephora terrestris TaxID=56493 RepID=A0A9P6HJK4_9AGAM|nr:hypothetical protein BJ322DRAFT_646934 [Thelephora terrestris]